MSVASTTDRLGLIRPADSDIFDPADYTATFDKLDAVPGTTIVDNYAGLTALNWGIPQHGSLALQADNRALWAWYNPSGTGSWKRANSVGLLKQIVQTADVVTSAQTGNGSIVVTTGNMVLPGGRAVHIDCAAGLDNTSGSNGLAHLTLTDNGSSIREFTYRVGAHYSSFGNAQTLSWYVTPVTPNSTHNFSLYVRSASGPTSVGAGGTSACRLATMSVVEV